MADTSQEEKVRLLIRNTGIELSRQGESFILPHEAINALAALAKEPHVQRPRRYQGLGKELRKTGEDAAQILKESVVFWDPSRAIQLFVSCEFPVRQDLASIPWESMPGPTGAPVAYDPKSLVTHAHPRLQPKSDRNLQTGNLRVLVLAPDTSRPRLNGPEDTQLTLDARLEIGELERRLDLLAAESLSHVLVLGPTQVVSPVNIRRALESFRPHIVHYIGHSDLAPGGQESRFVVDHDHDHSTTIAERDLLVLLMQLRPMPGLVLLNSCTSQGAPGSGGLPFRLQSLGIPHVITMRDQIEDAVAIAFAAELYRHLAAGSAIGPAVQSARHHLALAEGDHGDWFLPRLHSCRPEVPVLRVSKDHQKVGRIVSALPVAPRRVPFKGLRPYDLADRDIFVGRERQIAELLDAIVRNAWVVLHGGSAVGKTSLLKAGLLSRLDQSGLATAYIDVGEYRLAYERALADARDEPSRLEALRVAGRQIPDERVDVWLIDHIEHGASIDPLTFSLLALDKKPERVLIAARQDQAPNLHHELRKAGVDQLSRHTLGPVEPSEARSILHEFHDSGLEVRFGLDEGWSESLDLPGISMLFRQIYLHHANTPGRVLERGELESSFPMSVLWLREMNEWLTRLAPTTAGEVRQLLTALVEATGDGAEPDVSSYLLQELSGFDPDRFSRTLLLLERAYFVQWTASGHVHLRHPGLRQARLEPASQVMARGRRARVIVETGLDMWTRSGLPMRPKLISAVEEEIHPLDLARDELAFLLGSAALSEDVGWVAHLEAASLEQQKEVVESLVENGREEPLAAALTIAHVLPPHRRGPAPCLPSCSPARGPWARYAGEIVLQSLWREKALGEFNIWPRTLAQAVAESGKKVNDPDVLGRLPEPLGGVQAPSSKGWEGVRDAMSPVPKIGLVLTAVLGVGCAALYTRTSGSSDGLDRQELVLLLMGFLMPLAALWFAGSASTFARLVFDPQKPGRAKVLLKELSARHGSLAAPIAIFGSMSVLTLSALTIFIDAFHRKVWDPAISSGPAWLQRWTEDIGPMLAESFFWWVGNGSEVLGGILALFLWGWASVPLFLLPILWLTTSCDFLSARWPARRQWSGWWSALTVPMVCALGFRVFPTAVESSALLLESVRPWAFGESLLLREGELDAVIEGLFRASGNRWTAWLGALAPLIFVVSARVLGDRRLRLRLSGLGSSSDAWGPKSLWPMIAEATPEATELTLAILDSQPATRSPSSFDWLYCLAVGDERVLEERGCVGNHHCLSRRARGLLLRLSWPDVDLERYRRDLRRRLEQVPSAEARTALEELGGILDRLAPSDREGPADRGIRWHRLGRAWRRFNAWSDRLYDERPTDTRGQLYRRRSLAATAAVLVMVSILHLAFFVGGHLLDLLFRVEEPLGFHLLDFGLVWGVVQGTLLYLGIILTFAAPFVVWSKLFGNKSRPGTEDEEHG